MKKIAIHSVPRSGSSWVGEIFNSSRFVIYKHQPLFSYAFKNRLNVNSSRSDISSFFKELAETEDDFLDRKKERMEGSCPIFKKNEERFIVYKEVRNHHILKNLLKLDNELILIGIIRNPLSVINSWLRAPKEFRKDLGWNEIEEWRYAKKKNLDLIEEFNGFEKWKEVSKLFIYLKKKYSSRVFIIEYKDLLLHPTKVTKDMFSFCSIPFEKQTKDFLKQSNSIDQSKNAYSIFRLNQVDTKWKNELDPIIINEIKNDIYVTELEKYIK